MKPWTEDEIRKEVDHRVSDSGDAEDVAHFCMEILADTVQIMCETECGYCLDGVKVCKNHHIRKDANGHLQNIPCWAFNTRVIFGQLDWKGRDNDTTTS